MERFHVHGNSLMLSTPAVLISTDPLSPCIRHNKRQEGGFSRTFTLCNLSFRHHHLLPCFISGFSDFSGYNVASPVKACWLCLSGREGKSSTSWKYFTAQERGQFLPENVLQYRFQQMSKREKAAARQWVKH